MFRERRKEGEKHRCARGTYQDTALTRDLPVRFHAALWAYARGSLSRVNPELTISMNNPDHASKNFFRKPVLVKEISKGSVPRHSFAF